MVRSSKTNPRATARRVVGIFFPQRPILKMNTHAYTPGVLRKIVEANGHVKSHKVAAEVLRSVGDIAISDRQKKELGLVYKVCDMNKIEVVHLGFDLSAFQEDQEQKDEHRKPGPNGTGLVGNEAYRPTIQVGIAHGEQRQSGRLTEPGRGQHLQVAEERPADSREPADQQVPADQRIAQPPGEQPIPGDDPPGPAPPHGRLQREVVHPQQAASEDGQAQRGHEELELQRRQKDMIGDERSSERSRRGIRSAVRELPRG